LFLFQTNHGSQYGSATEVNMEVPRKSTWKCHGSQHGSAGYDGASHQIRSRVISEQVDLFFRIDFGKNPE